MTDFERTKQQVGRHDVMVTSWYDDARKSWEASAPAYAHLLSSNRDRKPGSSSRKAAIDRITSILSEYFRQAD